MAILRRRDLASKFYPSHGLVERSLLTLFLADGKYIRNTPSQKYWDSVPEHIAASIPIQTTATAFPIEGDKGMDIGKNFTGDFTSIINGYTGHEYTVQLVTAVPYSELSSFKFYGIDFTRVGSSSSYKLTCNPLKPAGITVECGTKMVVTIIQHSNSTYDLNV